MNSAAPSLITKFIGPFSGVPALSKGRCPKTSTSRNELERMEPILTILGIVPRMEASMDPCQQFTTSSQSRSRATDKNTCFA